MKSAPLRPRTAPGTPPHACRPTSRTPGATTTANTTPSISLGHLAPWLPSRSGLYIYHVKFFWLALFFARSRQIGHRGRGRGRGAARARVGHGRRRVVGALRLHARQLEWAVMRSSHAYLCGKIEALTPRHSHQRCSVRASSTVRAHHMDAQLYTLRACARCRRPLPRPPCIWRAIHPSDRVRGTRGKKGGILRDLKLSLEPVFQKMRSDGNYWQTR